MKFLESLKNDLSETSSENVTITVIRKDLEQLIKAYENQIKK